MRGGSQGLRRVLGTASVVLLIGLWQLVVSAHWVNPRFLSSPAGLAAAGWEMARSGDLATNLSVSLEEFVFGMLAALLVAVPFGLAMGWYRRLYYLLDPLLMSIYALPRDALLPVVIVWLGIGASAKAAIVFIGAIFPIVVNTASGIRQADPSWVKAARSFGARDREIFWKVLAPGCLPYLMSGIRLGIGRGVIGVIVAEMYVSIAGLGALIMKAQVGLDADKLMFIALFTALLGYLAVAGARQLERRVGRWRENAA